VSEIIVKPGDTLARIAQSAYGDATLAKTLATFNGIQDPNRIFVGQHIEIPSLQDLVGATPTPGPAPLGPSSSPAAPAPAPQLKTPNGFDELVATFGDIRTFI